MSIKSIVNMYTLTKEYKNAVTKFNRADMIEFNTYLKMNIGCKLSSMYRKSMDSEKYDYLKAKYDKYVDYDVLDKIITISKNKKNQQTSFTGKKEDIISETVETKVEEVKEQPKAKEEVKHVEEKIKVETTKSEHGEIKKEEIKPHKRFTNLEAFTIIGKGLLSEMGDKLINLKTSLVG